MLFRSLWLTLTALLMTWNSFVISQTAHLYRIQEKSECVLIRLWLANCFHMVFLSVRSIFFPRLTCDSTEDFKMGAWKLSVKVFTVVGNGWYAEYRKSRRWKSTLARFEFFFFFFFLFWSKKKMLILSVWKWYQEML